MTESNVAADALEKVVVMRAVAEVEGAGDDLH